MQLQDYSMIEAFAERACRIAFSFAPLLNMVTDNA